MTDALEYLKPGERIDDLQLCNMRIIQSPSAFRFSMDSVLLADFTHIRSGMQICDLGTGTGILPLLLYGREPNINCDAVEIQAEAAERAQRTMRLNCVEDRVRVHCRDLRSVRDFLPHGRFDLVICNPPYTPKDSALLSANPAISMARQETDCTLEDIADAASFLLKSRGRFLTMLPVARMAEAFDTLKKLRLEPKRLRFVHANEKRPARLVLIEAMLDVHSGLIIEAPLLVNDLNGNETDEVKRIYHQE